MWLLRFIVSSVDGSFQSLTVFLSQDGIESFLFIRWHLYLLISIALAQETSSVFPVL